MGSAYRKNMKNVMGRQDITGFDVLHVGSGLLGATSAYLADANGVAVYTMPRNARLNGMVVDTNGTTLTSGSLGVALVAAGTTRGSGLINSSSATYFTVLLDKENGNEVNLVAGDTVYAQVVVNETLSSKQALTARIHLELLES